MSKHQTVRTQLRETRHLVLDDRLIDEVIAAKLTLGEITKHPQNPLFGEDKPWEPRFDNVYANVIYDTKDRLYKCWYNPFIVDKRVTHTPPEKRHPDWCNYMNVKPSDREMAVCYAFSVDGLHWEKPELGLVEFEGNTQNNIVMRRVNGVGVFKDERETDPARRYKMFFCGEPQMTVAFSPDGLHWSQPLPIPEVEAHGTHPNAFWAETLGKYVGITRQHARSIRLVTRTESTDFVQWTPDETILEGVSPRLQTHDLIVFPTCGIYIGLLGIMVYPGDSDAEVKQHVELAWSPDTLEWHRIQEGTPFMGHTPSETERYGALPYDWGTIFPSAPIFFDDEIRIYYGAGDGYFFNWRKGYLALATLRPHGWAGYEPTRADTPAVITTQLLTFDRPSVGITADVWEDGSVRVAVLDKAGSQRAVSKPIYTTGTDSAVEWETSQDLASLSGDQVRLRFQLRNAKLYAFQIGTENG